MFNEGEYLIKHQPSNSKRTDVRPSDRWACTRNTWTAATRFEESIPLGRQTKNIIIIIEEGEKRRINFEN